MRQIIFLMPLTGIRDRQIHGAIVRKQIPKRGGSTSLVYGNDVPAWVVLGDVSVVEVAGSPVPEPATVITGALLLLPFGASKVRILRKTRTA
jgi:hypothetical protein